MYDSGSVQEKSIFFSRWTYNSQLTLILSTLNRLYGDGGDGENDG